MKENKKKIVLIAVGILITLGIVIGISYAWWAYRVTQESVNTITSGCLKIELADIKQSNIKLEKAYPLTDEEASDLKPYVFIIKNTCDTSVEYDVNLEIMEVANRLKDEYIAVSLDYGEKVLLNQLENTETIYNKGDYKAIEGKHLTTNILGTGESERYSLRMWMDEHVTINDDAMNKNFISKIVVNARLTEEEKEEKDNTILAIKENEYFWQHRENITKIIITKDTTPIGNAAYTYDMSVKTNGSVMSYLVANTSDPSTYTMYLKSERGITANKDSSYLFYRFTKLEDIEGLEYLDTGDVTTMNMMFSECTSIKTLDLSTFDTHNVVNFAGMFRWDYDLEDLNVSSFDTSNSTNMAMMFKNTSLHTLDVRNFNTSKVRDMFQMFHNIPTLKELDLSTFDTHNVVKVGEMFSMSTNLKKLDIRNFTFDSIREDDVPLKGSEGFFRYHFLTNMPTDAMVIVKDEKTKNWILNAKDGIGNIIYPSTWTEKNIIVAS